jgi:adenine-specific DNA methylase
MTQPKKLIEVALPIKEISAESQRDGRIQHSHISSLHKWWARRPLPVCRAVVFASLVSDPLDENCPQTFRDAIDLLLGPENNPGDPYRPYADIPWTSVYDPVEDNHRNRLQMFIGKFSDEMQQHLLHNKPKPRSGKQLSDASLIKWESKNDEVIIGKARKLIFVSHQCHAFASTKSATELLADFDRLYAAIKEAERELYRIPDRHIETEDVKEKSQALHLAIEAFLDHMPRVFDPFAGGGAIPLEAARLGCRSFGNDINPVAHIIQKGSLEFPQKYGKPITYSKEQFIELYGEEYWRLQPQDRKIVTDGEASGICIENRLSFDVDFYAKKILFKTLQELESLYPAGPNGIIPEAYYWCRTGTCSNPTCKAKVPLLKQFYLVNTENKKIFIDSDIKDKNIRFSISYGECQNDGWVKSSKLICPCCGSITNTDELKRQSTNGELGCQLLAVMEDSSNGKIYRIPVESDLYPFNSTSPSLKIFEEITKGDSRSLWLTLWGINTWGEMFTNRQMCVLERLLSNISNFKLQKNHNNEYHKAITTYLAIWLDRISARMTSFGIIDVGRETIVDPFGRQGISMVFDFPELNPFRMDQLSWILKVIESESFQFKTHCFNSSSGDKAQFEANYINATITDPPYYDVVPYADLSDFFYVWLKRILFDVYPLVFSTPLTPKSSECTALKHHHNGNKAKAKEHFERKLIEIFDAIEYQTSDISCIMFAHQSTEAWTTLCNSILASRMNITGSWATDTELTSALKSNKAFLSSSVTVCARPVKRKGIADYKQIQNRIEDLINLEVENLFKLGFRGADLLTACFGKAVSVFGMFEKVEKADGSEVGILELLEITKESAFNTLLKGFDGDEFTKFYIGWLQLYGFEETDFDDAAKFAKISLSINVSDLFGAHILLKNQNKQTLGTFSARLAANRYMGEQTGAYLIDQAHRLMHLYQAGDRNALVEYIRTVGLNPEGNLWRVITSLDELLPKGCDDHIQTRGLLDNKASLIREAKAKNATTPIQGTLFE